LIPPSETGWENGFHRQSFLPETGYGFNEFWSEQKFLIGVLENVMVA